MRIVAPGGRGGGLNLSTNVSVKLKILPSEYVKLDGVAPLITDPPQISSTTVNLFYLLKKGHMTYDT